MHDSDQNRRILTVQPERSTPNEMDENKKEIETPCDDDIAVASVNRTTDNDASGENALTDHERWTYPLSRDATGSKQLSYVHRMAQKFEELAESDGKQCWLRSPTIGSTSIKPRTGDGENDDFARAGARAIRSKSLECLLNCRVSIGKVSDGTASHLPEHTCDENECANYIVEERCSYDYESCRMSGFTFDHDIDERLDEPIENANEVLIGDAMVQSAAESTNDSADDAFLEFEHLSDDNESLIETRNLAFTMEEECVVEAAQEAVEIYADASDAGHSSDALSNRSSDSWTSSDEDDSATTVERPDSLASTSSMRLANILDELLDNERTYVAALRSGIRNYMHVFEDKDLPDGLRGRKYHMFGNMHRITDFHEYEFYPALQKCNRDIAAISNIFFDFIQKDYFYGYILYAINRYRSEQIFEQNRDYFRRRQNEIEDKLGLNSFLVQPIQRLPKYKLLLTQLISELGKNLEEDGVKVQIAACCKAEKRLQRLLDTVNESMNINDIVDCNEINPNHQGKFQKVDEFTISDVEWRRKYRGKVFLFDKCVIYTETLNKQKLFFRGFFRHETMGFTFQEGKNNFTLYVGRPGHQEIEFNAAAAIIQLWMQLLTNFLMRTVVVEKKRRIEERRRTRHSKSDLGPVNVLLRTNSAHLMVDSMSNAYSSGTSSSTWSSTGSEQSRDSNMSLNTISSQSSGVTNRTTWYTKLDEHDRKATECLLNSERYFIQLMSKATKDYLTNIADDIQYKLLPFMNAAKQILIFHTEIFYPSLNDCNLNISCICGTFKRHIETKMFHVYNVYAAHAKEAQSLLSNYCSAEEDSEQRDEYLREMSHALVMPIKHLENYTVLLEMLLNEFKEKDFVTEEFKTVASAEIEIKKLFKLVAENFNLNALRGATNCVRAYGLVVYSDTITVDACKYRILVLEKGLICVKIRMSTKTKKEKFVEQYFAMPLTAVLLLENEMYPKRLKVSANYAKQISFILHFATTRKKKQLIEIVRAQQRLD